MSNRNEISSLDILALFAFFIGLENYSETIDQTAMNDAIQGAVRDIHSHLKQQDTKIDTILQQLGGGKDER